ncbi:TM2 domain-containing protein [Enterococcus hulanensis]|nr:TM2 domain-containing protein [Enterococcus hulanensis]MBO0459394.1 TM2 domain-containing protein [Enterococcus hulanensis]
MPGHKKVNKMVYILLAFFLGGIGGHKFYSGKIGLGVVYLIFCWTFIPLIISFIEAILALGKTADQNGEMYI